MNIYTGHFCTLVLRRLVPSTCSNRGMWWSFQSFCDFPVHVNYSSMFLLSLKWDLYYGRGFLILFCCVFCCCCWFFACVRPQVWLLQKWFWASGLAFLPFFSWSNHHVYRPECTLYQKCVSFSGESLCLPNTTQMAVWGTVSPNRNRECAEMFP